MVSFECTFVEYSTHTQIWRCSQTTQRCTEAVYRSNPRSSQNKEKVLKLFHRSVHHLDPDVFSLP